MVMACRPPVATDRRPFLVRFVMGLGRRTPWLAISGFRPNRHDSDGDLAVLAAARPLPRRTRLDPAVRTLATLVVAAIGDGLQSLEAASIAAERDRVSAETLLAVVAHTCDRRFLPDERAALAYAAATAVGARVPDAVFAELRRHFSDRHIVELTVAIADEQRDNRPDAPPTIHVRGVRSVAAAV